MATSATFRRWNTIDENLAWNGGHPIVTGINKVGADKGDPVLVEAFDSAVAGQTPKGWGFNHRPKDVQLVAAESAFVWMVGAEHRPQEHAQRFPRSPIFRSNPVPPIVCGYA